MHLKNFVVIIYMIYYVWSLDFFLVFVAGGEHIEYSNLAVNDKELGRALLLLGYYYYYYYYYYYLMGIASLIQLVWGGGGAVLVESHWL